MIAYPLCLTAPVLGVLFAASVAAGPADLAAGKAIFQSRCALCHGLNGGGGRGPDLRRPKLTHASDEAALKVVISNGISPGMPAAWYLSPDELADVVAFVRSLSSIPQEKLAGDPERGRLICARSGCAGCHILDGKGETGERAWRFWTIPSPGEPGHETWTGDSWKTGGGSTWVTGAYDPELKLVYWGIGNPGPDWNGDLRLGDNLYTCSLVALDAATGKLRWYFQFTPHDTHDWDSAHVTVLFDAEVNGAKHKLVAMANRNAFYYVLDRVNGKFVAGRAYAKQTWAKGLDATGKPILAGDADPSPEGRVVWPNANGATVWYSTSFSPETGYVYVATREIASRYFKRETPYRRGAEFLGGGEDELPADDAWGAIRALQAITGEQRWEFKLHSPPWAGVMATAGGLVFSGSDEGNFYTLDAWTGKPLWDFQTGGSIGANPIAFNVDGHECVAIAADHVLFAFSLE